MSNTTWPRTVVGGVPVYQIPSFAAHPAIRHGFSARGGGVSAPPFDSMNLSFTRGDDEAAVRQNFERFCHAVGVSAQHLVLSAQTHGTALHYATEADCGNGFDRANALHEIDGLFTDRPDVVLCTQYADCVPLFFFDPVKKVIALSHAGWRGTAGDIAGKTVTKLQDVFGCDPADMLAGIGPSIGRCCFEVDAAVFDAFSALGRLQGDWFVPKGEKYHLDLWDINRQLLEQAGLDPRNISVSGHCTHCRPDEFWSHRTTGPVRGSLAAVLALTKE